MLSWQVAVKFIRFGRHKQYYERIIREIHLHMKLDHPNIIQLLGITKEFQGGSFPSLVFPWMPNGDLHCYIAYHGAGIEMSIKLSLARDIASGVAYLHKFHVVHGNLESKNVLMGPEPENRAYLTGFSLSTVLSTSELSNEYSNNPGKPRSGAVRFAAPECFIEEEGDNSLPMINSDIYSIGCILFHVFSGCLPWHYLKSNDIISGLRQHRTPSRPCGGGIDDSLWDFIERCWSFIPRNRPSAAQILNFFEKPYKLSGNGHVSPYDLTEMLPKILPAPIAFGSFADIRRCTLERDGKPLQVAVKSIRPLFNTEKTQRRYLHELRIWAALMQENILPLLGVAVIYGCCCPSMVCPWMENGTLSSYIRAYPTMELQHKLRLLRDVATGLRYRARYGFIIGHILIAKFVVHSQHVVHGDLTNNNILVDVNGRAVVADFGLSCRLSEFSGSPHSALTAAAQWMAPELMQIPRESKSHISRHSDMYSFGSIMNYVISGELPFQNQAQPYFALHMGEAPFTERGKDVSQEHWKFIQRCWGPFNCDDGTSSRPSAEEACNFLRKELESKLLITK
ncbi:kinase-like domain-containing protein [Suillus paluster]|uniref:kinase-like domain-containing protein n=1 Tax=Suillus paluster TaxID=48578 RepID=UPI001B87320F|nr:kinase-like domain-containing protein [Suillus paluster]KAG1731180.1 kinase-like domain-containing protein [Suillus paluster]